jgi:hypothetical protein
MAIKKFETLDGINSTGAVVVGNTVTVSGNLAVNTDTLYVDVSANNVGVNTTPNAAYALDVNGDMRATAYYGDGSNLTGVGADDATTLNGISSGSFLRSDVSDSYESGGTLSISNSSVLAVTSGSLRVNDNQSFGLGTGDDVSFTYNGTQLNVTGGDISFDSDTLFIDVSADSVGVNTTPAAGYALDVSGTIRATSFVGSGSQLTNITATNSTNANNATYFNTFSSSQFLRSDTTDTHTSGTLIIASSGLRVNDNTNLSLGTGANFTVNYDGTKVNAGGADLAIDTDTLYVDVSANRVGIGKTNPTTTLDVDGSVTATTYYGDGSNLTGIAAGGGDAETLDGINSTQFLRSDTSDTHTSGTLIINSDGLRLNDNKPLRFGTGSDVQIKHDGIDLNATGTGNVNFSTDGNVNVTNSVKVGNSSISSGVQTVTGVYTNEQYLSVDTNISIGGYITGGGIAGNSLIVTSNSNDGTGISTLTSGNGSVTGIYSSQTVLSTTSAFSANIVTAGIVGSNTFVATGGGSEGGEIQLNRSDRTTLGAFFDVDSANNARLISTSANIQFLTSTSTLAGYFNGDDLTVYGTVTELSDERLKENIATVDGTKVYDMRGVSYTKQGTPGVGVIAQELQVIAPELVTEVTSRNQGTQEDETYLGVAYGSLVGYLIEAIKDLKAEVEELKNT